MYQTKKTSDVALLSSARLKFCNMCRYAGLWSGIRGTGGASGLWEMRNLALIRDLSGEKFATLQ
jgi:hypothetical protein